MSHSWDSQPLLEVPIVSDEDVPVKPASSAIKFTGFNRKRLGEKWLIAVNFFFAEGEGAEKVREKESFVPL